MASVPRPRVDSVATEYPMWRDPRQSLPLVHSSLKDTLASGHHHDEAATLSPFTQSPHQSVKLVRRSFQHPHERRVYGSGCDTSPLNSASGGIRRRNLSDADSERLNNFEHLYTKECKAVQNKMTRGLHTDGSSEASSLHQQNRSSQQSEHSNVHHYQQQPNSSAPQQSFVSITRSSRYLREMDRREILTRIARGEKQSALAKEFHVSRAAICSLNKHRNQVLSRTDENPFAKHPKKPRLAKQQLHPVATTSTIISRDQGPKPTNSSASSLYHSNLESASDPEPMAAAIVLTSKTESDSRVFEIKSRSTALLLTMARSRNASISDFQRYTDRVMRLVIEYALALVPMNRLKNDEGLYCRSVNSSDYRSEYPPCGIAMLPPGIPMLDIFHGMEPTQPAGYVHRRSDPPGGIALIPQLPRSVALYNVFVFDVVIQDSSIELLVTTVDLLKQCGTAESMVWVVRRSISSRCIPRLHSKFPQLKIVAVDIRDRGCCSERDSSRLRRK